MINEIKNRFGQLIADKNWKILKSELGDLEPFQIAEAIGELPKSDRTIPVFGLLSRESAKETFKHLSHDQREEIIDGLAAHIDKMTDLLNDLDPDDRTAFFEELPGEVSQRLVQMLSQEEREVAMRLLGYPEDSIGRLMTPEYVAVRPYFTVAQALEHIRHYGRDSETLDVIYVVDEHWKLIDDIRIKEVILASPTRNVSEITDNRFVALRAEDDQEVAVRAFQDNNRTALPVIGGDGTLLGIVTVDDVMNVAEQESTEDFQKFGGTEGLDLSYTRTPLAEMVRKRAGWLVILFFGEMLTGIGDGLFRRRDRAGRRARTVRATDHIERRELGSQAASLIIRSLALGELKLRNWWYVMRKEIFSGLILGAILGIIGFVRIFVWQEAGLYDYGTHWPWIAASVSVSLVFIVLWGTLSGSMIPFILKKCGLDPATASAPFVATLVDVTGLIIYFSIAALFLTGKIL